MSQLPISAWWLLVLLIPFIIALIVALLIVTYWPWLIMLLPNLI